MIVHKSRISIFFLFCFILFFTFTPWEAFRNIPFVDKAVYFDSFYYGVSRLEYFEFRGGG